MNLKQHIAHWLGTIGVVVGIVTSPLILKFLPTEAAAILTAVSYAIKQLAPLFADAVTPPTS